MSISLSEILEWPVSTGGYALTESNHVRSRGGATIGGAAKYEDQPYKDSETLRLLVDELGSYRAVADRLGVSENTISKWGLEHGFEKRRPHTDKKTRAQWKRQIKEAIEAGTMPSQAVMAQRLGTSKPTVNRLVKEVRQELA